ncbi:hypothetical protein [Flavobacterium sp. HSC-61S13]|uniref:hypothetical protein n=1 Tax=Flavobacterium sp. HSC-61S13 TaxID=2910963 RepID=UPI00209C9EF1|nr:hypothetical protein [Flavobacterium sp. HSC-61S13]MCP1997089.1 hypothetical protein [Flavobacterium sp. HSC-61S13]
MTYIFKKYDWEGITMYEVNSEFLILDLLTGYYWTSIIIEGIIEGIGSTKDTFNDFKFQTEGDDLYIYSNSYGVQFFDLKSVKKEVDLVLSHDVFLGFLNDFKVFVVENS